MDSLNNFVSLRVYLNFGEICSDPSFGGLILKTKRFGYSTHKPVLAWGRLFYILLIKHTCYIIFPLSRADSVDCVDHKNRG